MKKLKTSGELNNDFEGAKSCDEEIFAEQKSNLLLVSGEHYRQVERGLREKLRDSTLPSKQKIKITKNHVQKICNREVNGIAALAPDVKCTPANPSELQDKKAAELFQAVKMYADRRYKLAERKEQWIEDLVQIGEVACLIRWDVNKGDLINYHQKMDDAGNPVFLAPDGTETNLTGVPEIDEMLIKNPAPDEERPVFSGDFVFERVYGFNLFRCPDAEDMDESPYLIIDKMCDPEDVKAMIPDDDPEREDKLGYVTESASTTFRVFDTNKLSFSDSKGKVHLRYHYYRPGIEYPNGYFYICTDTGIITHGELPFGVFPVVYRGHTRMATSPRHRSRIKVIRPYQTECNRASSQRVHHQLTHGDDKLITRPGAKASQEATLPGVRTYKAFGDVTVIPGRTGDQFAGYITEIINEMYQVVDEEPTDEQSPQMDPVALLFSSVKRSKKYGKQARVMISFLQELYGTFFKLAKHYYDENHFVNAVGKSEMINLAEFKNAKDVSVSIQVEASNSDATDMLGRYLFTQNALQYVGKDLPKETIGRILSNMPFANSEQILGPMMANYKNVENDMLAMDRGEMRPAEPDDDHKLYIMELTGRIKAPDFKGLHPAIQQMYMEKREQHRQFQAQQVQQLQMETQKFIPMGGNFVKCDMYVMKDGKQQRATFPDESLKWLDEKLKSQGMTQDTLAALSQADQLAIAQQAAMQTPQDPNQMMMNNQGGLSGNGQQPVAGF